MDHHTETARPAAPTLTGKGLHLAGAGDSRDASEPNHPRLRVRAVTRGAIRRRAMPNPHPISGAALWEALMHVEDPELGVDLVNLGLVRDVSISEGTVHLLMTLTSIGCPVAEDLELAVQTALASVSGVKGVRVTFTFDPPWSPEAITEDGRDQLMALGYI